MKLLAWLILLLAVCPIQASAESARRTIGDMYMESYDSAMKKYLAAGTGEVRAEAYRSRYQECDSDHNCSDRTAATRSSDNGASRADKGSAFVKHMPNVLVLQ